MAAVKNAFHDEICWQGMDADGQDEAEFYASVEAVGCPYKPGDMRVHAWLDGYGAALDWAKQNLK